MNEPPDPGGTIPHASEFVIVKSTCTVDNSPMDIPDDVRSYDSSVDTDGSRSQPRPHKRIHLQKKCRHCNKRKKKNSSLLDNKFTDCQCLDSEVVSEKKISFLQPALISNQNSDIILSNKSTPNIAEDCTIKNPTPVGRSLYTETDNSPYIIHVQRIQSSPNDGTTIHPVTFGKFLKNNCIQNIINGSLKRIGRNRITLSFSSYSDANLFLGHKSLESNKLKAFIPTFNVTRMGLVRGVPVEWSPEDIIENINVPIGCGKILKVRRINYKVNVDGATVWKPSQSVVVTFDGQILPKRIFMCFNALQVELYTYPTIQCYNCCRYGHTKLQCRSKPKCYKCGKEHTGESCNIDEDYINCCMCGGSHFATNKSCPEYNRQKQIKITMAQNCMSYPEASKMHHPVSRPYSDVLASNVPRFISSESDKKTTPVSYKKTVYREPRRTPKVNHGYNQLEHRELIKDYNTTSSQNGCALKNTNENDDLSIGKIIIALIKFLTQSQIIPSNEVTSLLPYLNLPNNGSSDNSMECSKPHQQEK